MLPYIWILIAAIMLETNTHVMTEVICDAGWIDLTEGLDTRMCVKIYAEPATWNQAKEICETSASHLLILDDQYIAEAGIESSKVNGLRHMHTKHGLPEIWSALHFAGSNMYWYNSVPQPLRESRYWQWSENHHIPLTDAKLCGKIVTNSQGNVAYNLSITTCDEQLPFVCINGGHDTSLERRSDSCGWRDWLYSETLHKCYIVSSGKLLFSETQGFCQSRRGADVVQANTYIEQQVLLEYVKQINKGVTDSLPTTTENNATDKGILTPLPISELDDNGQDDTLTPGSPMTTYITTPLFPHLQCYTCNDSHTEEDCEKNGQVERCADPDAMCETELLVSEEGKVSVTKRCSTQCTEMLNRTQLHCYRIGRPDARCFDCCETDLCNDNVVDDLLQRYGFQRRKRDLRPYTRGTITGNYWIGLRSDANSTMTWSDGVQFEESNRHLLDTEFNSGPGCGLLMYSFAEHQMYWAIFNCDNYNQVICERRPSYVPISIHVTPPLLNISSRVLTQEWPASEAMMKMKSAFQCVVSFVSSDAQVLWIKDGTYIDNGPPPLGFMLQVNQSLGDILYGNHNPGVGALQGYYQCQVWGESGRTSVISTPAFYRFRDVLTYRGEIGIDFLPLQLMSTLQFELLTKAQDAGMVEAVRQWLQDLISLTLNGVSIDMDVHLHFLRSGTNGGMLHFSLYYVLPKMSEEDWNSILKYLGLLHYTSVPGEDIDTFLDRLEFKLLAELEANVELQKINETAHAHAYLENQTGVFEHAKAEHFTLRSTVACPALVHHDHGLRLEFERTMIGDKAVSTLVCLEDGIPYAEVKCEGDFSAGASWGRIEYKPNCQPITKSNVTDSLFHLTQANIGPIECLNAMVNLTKKDMVHADIVYSSIILTQLTSSYRSASLFGDKLLTVVSQLMNSEHEVLRQAQAVSNAPSKIVQALETFTSQADVQGQSRLKFCAPNLCVLIYDSAKKSKAIERGMVVGTLEENQEELSPSDIIMYPEKSLGKSHELGKLETNNGNSTLVENTFYTVDYGASEVVEREVNTTHDGTNEDYIDSIGDSDYDSTESGDEDNITENITPTQWSTRDLPINFDMIESYDYYEQSSEYDNKNTDFAKLTTEAVTNANKSENGEVKHPLHVDYEEIEASITLPQEVIDQFTKSRLHDLPFGNPAQDPTQDLETLLGLHLESHMSRVTYTVYRTASLFVHDAQFRKDGNNTNSTYQLVNSRVIASSVNGYSLSNLSEPVISIFKMIKDMPAHAHKCVWWDFTKAQGKGNWSSDGCWMLDIVDNRIVCACNHLTNFAILADMEQKTMPRSHLFALSAISIFGLSLSMLGLSVTMLSFLLFKKMRRGRSQKVLFNLAVSLLCLDAVFLIGINQTRFYSACVLVAILLHYFLLTSFAWMLVEGILQYLKFVKVLNTYVNNFMYKVAVPAWGLPGMIVVCCVAVNVNFYRGPSNYCWVDLPLLYYGVALPIALVIFTNALLFSLVLKGLTCDRPKGLTSTQSKEDLLWLRVRAAVCCLVLLGLTWIFGFVAIHDARLPFQYLFCICNTTQGFVIFICHVCREKSMRDAWVYYLCYRSSSSPYTHNSSAFTSQQSLHRIGIKNDAQTCAHVQSLMTSFINIKNPNQISLQAKDLISRNQIISQFKETQQDANEVFPTHESDLENQNDLDEKVLETLRHYDAMIENDKMAENMCPDHVMLSDESDCSRQTSESSLHSSVSISSSVTSDGSSNSSVTLRASVKSAVAETDKKEKD